ncbi:VOC family protein [Janthinobacterium sp.]|uniref:VOC family protein n=1 Tax=Janthinobacterium sp. TaxID=1871054 RepID=UPI00293D3939|nr:VOC family protein [Janthinobacterium sp.]
MEIDHIFIRVKRGAPEAKALRQFGLTEGSPNTHTGQGTANRRFFFDNAFIELLWLEDAEAASSELTRPTLLLERLTPGADEVSPFGVCFRPSAQEAKSAPFPSWQYRPVYLPPGLAVDVASAPPSEPMWFFLAFGSRPDAAPALKRQPLQAAAGLGAISALRIVAPHTGDSAGVAAMAGIALEEGAEHLLEISFDDAASGRSYDFRPRLPLVFKW